MIPELVEASIASIIPVFRVQLCEFVASKFFDRNVKNEAAISKSSFIKISSVKQRVFYGFSTIKL